MTQSRPAASPETDELVPVTTTINGRKWSGAVRPDGTLLDLLRDEIGLLGTKRGCEWMSCGACTVIVDGRPVSSCGFFASDVDGLSVRTVESLADEDGRLTPLQQAFVENVASQCGYCTSGQLMSATALLESGTRPSRTEIQRWMQTNLCRCASYAGILAAIETAVDVSFHEQNSELNE
jgi:aerobic-type carbon monoxide dehydrogenase small subunit (CoxS/CutS family)